MSIPIFLMITFIWIAILHIKKEHASRLEENESKEFWKREHQANNVRKKDLSTLSYITIPLDTLPIKNQADEELMEIYQTIRSLADKKIVNLSNKSNTDLKLEYGVSNLDMLSEFDNNFTILIQTIAKWGRYLYERSELEDCQTVLEYGIQCNTDIKSNYVLLAQIYKSNEESSKISHLITRAEQLNTLIKKSIVASLVKIQEA